VVVAAYPGYQWFFLARGRRKYFADHKTWPKPETAQEKPLAPRVVAAMALPLIRCHWRIWSYDRESCSLFGTTWSVLCCKQHWKLSNQYIGSSYRCNRKERGGRNDFCDRQEDLQRSSWLVQSGESERQKIEQLCELLQQHFKPKRLVFVESYRFHLAFKKETKPSLFTTPVWDIWRWLVIFFSSAAFEIQRPLEAPKWRSHISTSLGGGCSGWNRGEWERTSSAATCPICKIYFQEFFCFVVLICRFRN